MTSEIYLNWVFEYLYLLFFEKKEEEIVEMIWIEHNMVYHILK